VVDNTLGGLSATSNTNGVLISGNTITGALSCSGNTPNPTDGGTPNSTGGAKTGQCALM
jgi:hexosaminidase